MARADDQPEEERAADRASLAWRLMRSLVLHHFGRSCAAGRALDEILAVIERIAGRPAAGMFGLRCPWLSHRSADSMMRLATATCRPCCEVMSRTTSRPPSTARTSLGLFTNTAQGLPNIAATTCCVVQFGRYFAATFTRAEALGQVNSSDRRSMSRHRSAARC